MFRAVIMAGGSGTRFWPMSRKALPKQFLTFHSDRSLLQQAYDRIRKPATERGVFVVTNQAHVGKTKEQLPDLGDEQIVGEPCGRDTAACIALAAAVIASREPEAVMMALAADHVIEPIARFHQAIATAESFLAERPEALLTFGVPPTRPSTGYGYLRKGPVAGPKSVDPSLAVAKVASFHEKPNQETADRFLASGEYFWNSGIFCWRVETILTEIRNRLPELHAGVTTIAEAWHGSRRDAVLAEVFPTLPKISIDYAVMEKSPNVYMVEAPFQWDDVGSWLALERVFDKTPDRNTIIGDHLGMDTENSVIVGDRNHLIATIGVKDLIIVHTEAITLVAHRDDEQSVKQLLQQIENLGLDRLL